MVKKAAVRKKDNRPFFALLGLIALAGIGAIAWFVTRPKSAAVTTVDPGVPVEAQGYLLGNPNAPVQVIEFADFECPACSQFATLTEPDVRTRLVDRGIISYRFYDFPLQIHRNTWDASHAAACANEQGKFWEMHDEIFNGQDRWNGQATGRPKSVFEGYARSIGLNVGQWEQCYDSKKYQRQIEANLAEGERRNVGSTPTFIIGSRMIATSMGYDQFKAYVDSALAEAGASGADTSAKAAPAGTQPK